MTRPVAELVNYRRLGGLLVDLEEMLDLFEAEPLHGYPMITWNHARRQALQLFVHVHNNWRSSRNSINVGVDVWDFMPVRFEEIVERTRSLPVNEHWADVERGAKDPTL